MLLTSFLGRNAKVWRFDLSWLLILYSKVVRDFGQSLLRRGDMKFF